MMIGQKSRGFSRGIDKALSLRQPGDIKGIGNYRVNHCYLVIMQ